MTETVEITCICVFNVYLITVIKLILFLVCRRIDNPATRALAHDHRNDVISNSGAIACGLIGMHNLYSFNCPVTEGSKELLVQYFTVVNENGKHAKLLKLNWIRLLVP